MSFKHRMLIAGHRRQRLPGPFAAELAVLQILLFVMMVILDLAAQMAKPSTGT